MKNSNETIKVASNQSTRTFTIRKYIDGKLFAKYRTIPMSKNEFESSENDTQNDWANFLRSIDDYYRV